MNLFQNRQQKYRYTCTLNCYVGKTTFKPATTACSSQVVFHFSQHSLLVLQKPLISYVFQEKSATNIHFVVTNILVFIV